MGAQGIVAALPVVGPGRGVRFLGDESAGTGTRRAALCFHGKLMDQKVIVRKGIHHHDLNQIVT